MKTIVNVLLLCVLVSCTAVNDSSSTCKFRINLIERNEQALYLLDDKKATLAQIKSKFDIFKKKPHIEVCISENVKKRHTLFLVDCLLKIGFKDISIRLSKGKVKDFKGVK